MKGYLDTMHAYECLQIVTGGWYVDPSGIVYGPKATYQPIPEAHTQPDIYARSVIHHTNAGSVYATWQRLLAYWRRIDITGEAHAQIDLDGTFAQAIPLTKRADCNAKANRWRYGDGYYGALSWETADHGGAGIEHEPWTLEQLATIIAVDTVACVAYGIACTDVPSWTASGLAAHNRHREWTIYKGKTCPGAARTRQMDHIRSEVASRVARFHDLNGSTCPGSVT